MTTESKQTNLLHILVRLSFKLYAVFLSTVYQEANKFLGLIGNLGIDASLRQHALNVFSGVVFLLVSKMISKQRC